jgi:hypothetical protein
MNDARKQNVKAYFEGITAKDISRVPWAKTATSHFTQSRRCGGPTRRVTSSGKIRSMIIRRVSPAICSTSARRSAHNSARGIGQQPIRKGARGRPERQAMQRGGGLDRGFWEGRAILPRPLHCATAEGAVATVGMTRGWNGSRVLLFREGTDVVHHIPDLAGLHAACFAGHLALAVGDDGVDFSVGHILKRRGVAVIAQIQLHGHG